MNTGNELELKWIGWNWILMIFFVFLAAGVDQNELVRASPAVLNMWSCLVNLDEEKSKHSGLAQEYSFGSA